MARFALAFMTVFLGVSVAAAAPIPKAALDDCKAMSEMANLTMDLRQRGVSMAKLMDNATEEEDAYWRGVQRMLVEQAFNRQRFDTTEARANAISDFENVTYMACLDNLKRKFTDKR
ncbi:hypothetical protein ACOTCL_18100 [Achromobacter xylosoxidans]